MTELCREFGISRKTGYKWEQRFLDGGVPNLIDRSSRPAELANATPVEVVERIVKARRTHPTWGPKKLYEVLTRADAELELPALSTIAAILKRYGLVKARRSRRRTPQMTFPLAAARAPNDVWCTDFKGKFRVDRKYCHPLTITDACSRSVLRCTPLEQESFKAAKPVFEAAFREYGLPLRMRSDNGSPFASTGLGGLSQLGVWWVKLGILPERIEPGCPEQNGRHERMHLTLKTDVASPPLSDWNAEAQALEVWRYEFNHVRPHEALGMKTPAEVYTVSPRHYPEHLGDPTYPAHFDVRKVMSNGEIVIRQKQIFIARVLCSEHIGLEPIDDGLWHLWFGPVFLGRLRELGRSKFHLQREFPEKTT
jgi:putative transposase